MQKLNNIVEIVKQAYKKKYHYYSFVFTISEEGTTTTASIYLGNPKKIVTKSQINSAKKAAGMSSDAVMLSCSYLGKMTKYEFVFSKTNSVSEKIR
jgi:hypothetical protein